jgi:thiol-disulfide isomerase/thioredoxin
MAERRTIYRTINALLLITIIAMLVVNRERFWAMVNPKGRDLVTQTAPELAPGPWYNSEGATLSSLRGKVVLLDFWAFQCRNCTNVLPVIKRWDEKYREQGLVIIGIHTPQRAEEASADLLKRFIADNKVAYPVLIDNSYANWNRYRVQFWPTTFLIDRKGVIRGYHNGELGFSGLEGAIMELLHE